MFSDDLCAYFNRVRLSLINISAILLEPNELRWLVSKYTGSPSMNLSAGMYCIKSTHCTLRCCFTIFLISSSDLAESRISPFLSSET